MEFYKIDWNYIVQNADQHESVYEIYRKQNNTNSVVSISERFEKKVHQQRTLEKTH